MEFSAPDGREVGPLSPGRAADDELTTIEDFLELSTAELRYFLLNLGESIAGCRAELAERAVFARHRSQAAQPSQPKKFKLERGDVRGEYASVLEEYGLTDPDAAGGWCPDISAGLPALDLGKIFHYVLAKEAFETYYLSEYRSRRAYRYLEAVCVRSIQIRRTGGGSSGSSGGGAAVGGGGDFAFVKGAIAPLDRAGTGFDADRPPHVVKVLTTAENEVVVSCCSCTDDLYQCCNHVIAVLLRVERLKREMTAREAARSEAAAAAGGESGTAPAPVRIADLFPRPDSQAPAADGPAAHEERRLFAERVCRTLPNCLFAQMCRGGQTPAGDEHS